MDVVLQILSSARAFIEANSAPVFFLGSILTLSAAGWVAWKARTWLRDFDANDLHVSMKGPKGKLCPTLNAKLDKIQSHKQTMLLSAANEVAKLVIVGAFLPSALLGLFVHFHDTWDLADGAFLRAGTGNAVSSPSVDETLSFVESQLLRSGFDFAEVTDEDNTMIVLNKSVLTAKTVILVYRTFVQTFAVGIPTFILLALWLGFTRTRQERDLLDRLTESNCSRTPSNAS